MSPSIGVKLPFDPNLGDSAVCFFANPVLVARFRDSPVILCFLYIILQRNQQCARIYHEVVSSGFSLRAP